MSFINQPTSPDNHFFIDTNVLLDIIYDQRQRHKLAMDFYKRFKNLELSVVFEVFKEANKVVEDYCSGFARDFSTFLISEEKHSTKWDDLSRGKKIKRLEDFKNWVNSRYKDDAVYPFYNAILTNVEVYLPDRSYSDIREFLLNLPSYFLLWLKVNIQTRFSIHIAISDISNDNVRKFQDELDKLMRSKYFDKTQKGDVRIIIELILLILYGSEVVREYKQVTFYTLDNLLSSNFFKFKREMPIMNDTEFNDLMKKGLERITIEAPY
ncbi:MAG: hypothetical protein QXZ17_13055 [Nitrososphaerota archaeon]